MSEELADSDVFDEPDIDIESAQDEIATDLFDAKPEPVDKTGDIIDQTLKTEDEPDDKLEDEPEDKPENKPELRAAPASWRKEMHEFWNGLDPAVQSYIEQRETEMRNGLDLNKNDSTLGRDVRDAATPYSDLLKQQNLSEAQAFKYLMNAHAKLSNAPPEQKQALLEDFGKAYGVNINSQVDPTITALQSKVNEMETFMTQSQQQALQAQQDQIMKDVEKFASDPAHPYFDELETEIASLIQAGFSLEEAYEKAVWVNPLTRQKENDRLLKEREDMAATEAKEKAAKAKKAKAVNVRSRDTQNAPTEPTGTMDDTLRETYLDIQNRN